VGKSIGNSLNMEPIIPGARGGHGKLAPSRLRDNVASMDPLMSSPFRGPGFQDVGWGSLMKITGDFGNTA